MKKLFAIIAGAALAGAICTTAVFLGTALPVYGQTAAPTITIPQGQLDLVKSEYPQLESGGMDKGSETMIPIAYIAVTDDTLAIVEVDGTFRGEPIKVLTEVEQAKVGGVTLPDSFSVIGYALNPAKDPANPANAGK